MTICSVSARQKMLRRSGLTLLFVISFIVLFLLMGTAFVVVSTQFVRTSKQRARLESDRTPGKVLIYRAVHDIIAGPSLDNHLFADSKGHRPAFGHLWIWGSSLHLLQLRCGR